MDNQNELLEKLRSGGPDLVSEAVKEIQENGDLAMAEALLDVLGQRPAEFPESVVVGLLADIRDADFRACLFRRLQQATVSVQKVLLLRIAWESALDYSAHWEFFLDLLSEDEFEVALEASTVLEETVRRLSPEQRGRLGLRLQDGSLPQDRKFLIAPVLEELACAEE